MTKPCCESSPYALGMCLRCYKADYGRKWRRRNPERARANDRATHRSRRTVEAEYNRRRYWEKVGRDPDYRAKRNADLLIKRRTGQITRSETTKAKQREGQRRRRAADPVKVRLAKHERRAGRSSGTREYMAMLLRDPCSYCGGSAGEIDHIVAVARGGSNAADNLTSACKRCNSSKGDRSLITFLCCSAVEVKAA